MAHEKPPVKTCANLETDLVLYHYGELNGSERARIEAHLGVCAGCRLYVNEAEAIAGLTLKPDEPPQEFWQNYTREMRHKLVALSDQQPWWRRVAAAFQPWMMPAFGTTAVVAMALAFTLGRGVWQANEAPPELVASMEVMPMAEHLEFYSNMEVLDSLELLEYMVTASNGAV